MNISKARHLRKLAFGSHRYNLMSQSSSNSNNRLSSINSHLSSSPSRTMSSAGIVALTPQTPGEFHVPQITEESSKIASQLLQENHDKFHMYFNVSGFHNHIAHHLLAAFALGATPPQLQRDYDVNASYQRPQFPVEQRNVESMADPVKFKEFLNKEKYFHDYEVFFQQEIDAANGNWGEVLHKHLFSKTEHANDMLARTFAGFYHPIIHLGYGIEFRQPAIIAEALAQASTHDNWTAPFILAADKKAREAAQQGNSTKSLVQILKEARANDTIRNSVRSGDANKVRDGVFARAADETSSLVSQWRVNDPNDPVELRRKTAEMINACAFFAGAAQHHSHEKQIKFDFFYMHCINCSLFFSAFLDPINDAWLSNADRARLIEYKGWSDVSLYISRGTPELFLDEIKNYQAKRPDDGWAEIFRRACALTEDDGHSIKLVRAIGNGHQTCSPLEGELDETIMPIRGDMWLKLAHMAIDSVEGASTRWIRNAGFEEAWKDIPDRKDGFPDGQMPRDAKGEHYHETH